MKKKTESLKKKYFHCKNEKNTEKLYFCMKTKGKKLVSMFVYRDKRKVISYRPKKFPGEGVETVESVEKILVTAVAIPLDYI